MRSNKTTIGKRLWIFLMVILVVIAGGWMWWVNGISSVDSRDTDPVSFTINRGEGVKSIASRLAGQRLIGSPTSFYILVKLLGIEKSIQAGDYRLTRAMDAKSIALELTHGLADAWLTTLEGWRVEEVATKIASELAIPEKEFLKYAREGYMFPDTYLIPRDASPSAVAGILRDTFERKVTEKMRQDAARLELTLDEVITMASIVEREGRTDADRPVIAGILLKRLKEGWPLQADATVQYALGYQESDKTWWKKELTDEDKKIKSPYNTYAHPELPPAAIANPGLASIMAVIYPQETDYWYYLHDPKGVAHYARTLDEHEQNISTYLR
ncbi:endolytic transglycosylase MltG [Patescibacteria group bacterium]|nr:endolytic transglycosylase MltG [Patescibacteria group bacterium]MBU2460410.1 endolytic transglycosylase MltG [Patescibacteria group bacterium]